MSLVLENLSGKSYLLNIFDTPGHVNFSDEVVAACRLSDGVVVIVDVVEGVNVQTERVILHACQQQLPICVVLNKMDRLILELKLPPTEAYYKVFAPYDFHMCSSHGHQIRHVIATINEVLATAADAAATRRVSPELGNVCFASGLHGWSFTLSSFADLYFRSHGIYPD